MTRRHGPNAHNSLWSMLRMMTRSRRFGAFLCLLGFVWGVTLIQMVLVPSPTLSSQELREDILGLSEKYVRQLAQETQDTIDGPYAGRLTGYDLKKTMAVLLENIMNRMDRLEARLNQATANGTGPIPPGNIVPALGESSMGERPPRVERGGREGRDVGQAGGREEEPPKDRPPQQQRPVNAKALILGVQENCTLTAEENVKFPHCNGKIAWMATHWETDSCYALYGVDGSQCSYRVYLSEVESWCPLLPGRSRLNLNTTAVPRRTAKIKMDLEGLLSKLSDPVNRKENYAWIRQRITRMWPDWTASTRALMERQNLTAKRPQKRILLHLGLLSAASQWNIAEKAAKGMSLSYDSVLVHLGLLSKKSGFKIAENSFKGGPLGELVQWSDIISSLYILGHDISITSEVEQLAAILTKITIASKKPIYCPWSYALVPWRPELMFSDISGLHDMTRLGWFKRIKDTRTVSKLPTAESQCQSREELPIDMIFIDIVGLTQFKKRVKKGYGKFSCLMRVIDSFGTEPAFNYEPYAKAHRMKTTWGMQNLNPQQFYTMFPHSPDNSFMGFVVEQHLNHSVASSVLERRDQAVVYGKAEYMWQGKEEYLEILRKYVDIHGTVFLSDDKQSIIPTYVNNHGILSGPDLHRLLRESKIFVGLGFPYEGPAPLEALAQGAVYINPRFDPPHNSLNTKFFKGKPTLRTLSSQHPYAEEFIGTPNVYTVDVNDREELEKVIQQALADVSAGRVKPYMPFEFTREGMLQRINTYIEHQDFCAETPNQWPPRSAITVLISKLGQSCKEICRSKDLICEPSYFKELNTVEVMETHAGRMCAEFEYIEEIYFPAYRPGSGQCLLQKQPLLYSCVGEAPEIARLCPCRNYIKGQTALCKECVSWNT